MQDQLLQAAQALRRADALLISAGAGMGVDSGLPDFRGREGFWRSYPVLANLRLSFEEMANPAAFQKDPSLAWAFYGHRLNLYRQTNPHPGFSLLLDYARKKPNGFFVFTSNVDGHFQKAGFPEDALIECHGSIHHFQCAEPCSKAIWEASPGDIPIDEKNFRATQPLPLCPHCHSLARPNILMFNDIYWIQDRTRAQNHLFELWLQSLIRVRSSLAVLECGAGTAVPTVRYISERTASLFKGTLIRINPRESEVPTGGISLALGAEEGIKKLLSAS
jgi:NAD-dependent SIR2 family protein deacetylase